MILRYPTSYIFLKKLGLSHSHRRPPGNFVITSRTIIRCWKEWKPFFSKIAYIQNLREFRTGTPRCDLKTLERTTNINPSKTSNIKSFWIQYNSYSFLQGNKSFLSYNCIITTNYNTFYILGVPRKIMINEFCIKFAVRVQMMPILWTNWFVTNKFVIIIDIIS